MDRKGVVSRDSVKFFCLTVPKNFIGEPFSDVFPKISGLRKFYGKESGGSIKYFCRNLCLTVPKISVEEPFCAALQNLSGSEKSIWIRRREVSTFSAEKFLSHSAEKFRRGTLLLCVSQIFRLPKVYGKQGGGGVSRVSVESFLSHSAEKFGRGTLVCCTSE